MRSRFLMVAGLVGVLTLGHEISASEPSNEAIKAAAERAVSLIESSTKEYPHQRDCFSCHHQAVPMFALTLAQQRGFTVSQENLQDQLELTTTDLRNAIEDYRKGKGQPGGVTRAGYALWTLELGGWKSDETTAAVTEFLLVNPKNDDHWKSFSNRPPSEGSHFTSTFVALRGLDAFGALEQAERRSERSRKAKEWLVKSAGVDTEDQVFRLRALRLVKADEDVIRAATARLTESQRADGGWAQIASGESDAYATGLVLAALHQAGGLPTDDPAFRRGLAYLIKEQKPDGSWYVKSRSRPFQTYFESGFPHGKDQFISVSGSSWATAALLLALPKRAE